MTSAHPPEIERRLEALAEAVGRFAKERSLLRALTSVKQMMDLAPKDPRTERCLALIASPEVRGFASPQPHAAEPAPSKEGWQTIPPGVVLAAIPLLQKAVDLREREIIEIDPFVPSEAEAIAAVDDGEEMRRPEFPVTPLFSGLDALGFDLLVDRLKVQHVAKGQAIFREGELSRSLYVISEGAVRILLETPQRKEIARLDAGEFFGEIALITDRPRTATVEAIEDTQLIEIDPSAVSALLMADPHAMHVLLWFLRDRLVDLLIRTNALFRRLSHTEGKRLASRFTIVEAKGGATLIEQGAKGRGMMIILSGQAEVIRYFGEDATPLATLEPGDVFGEMSLLTKEPALASVRAKGRFIALELLADRFHEMMRTHPELTELVTRLAEERRRRFVDIVGGQLPYGEGHLELV